MLLVGAPPALAPSIAHGAGEPAVREGGVYRRPLGNDPATLDPVRVSDLYGRAVTEQIFDGLVQFDQTLSVTPSLARYWRASRDGLVWTFTLRQGVHFHHGRELTSDDVVFSLSRILDPKIQSGASELFSGIEGAQEFREGRASQVSGLRAVDRYTVQVTLREASTPFVSVLALGHAKVVPRDVVEKRGDAFGREPVGTGPFQFSSWERKKEIVLTANRDYFGGAPRLALVVYRIYPGELSDVMCRDFDRGELEESPVPPVCRAKVSDPRYQYVRRVTFSVRFYGLQTRLKPLADVRVRRAIAHAIDRDALLNDVFAGRFQPAPGILPPGMPGYNPQIKPMGHAPARARELLREAGYPEGRGLAPITLWSGARSERLERELEMVTRQLAAVGIRSEVRFETDWPTFSRQLAEGRLPMFVYAWYADVPEPDNFLSRLFYSRSPRNLTGYTNPVVDNLLLQARAEKELERRSNVYRRAEQIIIDDAPVIPIWHYPFERLFQGNVRSVEVNGLGDPYIPLRKIWLEERR
jgi:peptide/nickel transport system substrate-binding protein/oligopeptide transport system substrate-binding protein